MNIVTKSKSEINKDLLAELKQFKNDHTTGKLPSLTNVTLNQYLTKIVQRYTKPHEAVRSSFEYQLFLSVHRNTPLHKSYVG